MRVMGVDPSTKTGWAVLEAHGEDPRLTRLGHGEINFPKAKGIERIQLIGREVSNMVERYSPALVIIEGYAYAARGNQITSQVEIGTSIRLSVQGTGRPWTVATPSVLKKFVTGKGTAKKDVIMLNCFKQWGFEGTDNECDAFGLAALGVYCGTRHVEPELSAAQKDCFKEWKIEHRRFFPI